MSEDLYNKFCKSAFIIFSSKEDAKEVANELYCLYLEGKAYKKGQTVSQALIDVARKLYARTGTRKYFVNRINFAEPNFDLLIEESSFENRLIEADFCLKLFKNLPYKSKAIMILYYCYDYTLPEIAKILSEDKYQVFKIKKATEQYLKERQGNWRIL